MTFRASILDFRLKLYNYQIVIIHKQSNTQETMEVESLNLDFEETIRFYWTIEIPNTNIHIIMIDNLDLFIRFLQ
ncbi:hypothetical protein L6452_09717 [Arctium lappa]|uniref:Uncharacterized protein n=1 Tax=Arctium lappa TaxID=4217 RepID=A0ACB9DKS7_ARCLA|nr:hypothetical protein L6452_09717 [Arctium lappa]